MKAKDKLSAFTTAFIEEDVEQSKKVFHEYLRLKTQSILVSESDKDEDECDEIMDDEDQADKDEDKDEKKSSKKSKKDKKYDEEDEEDC